MRMYSDTDFTDTTDFIKDFFRLVPKIVIGKHLATSKRAVENTKTKKYPCESVSRKKCPVVNGRLMLAVIRRIAK